MIHLEHERWRRRKVRQQRRGGIEVYRARFFGHKFDLSGVLHVDFLPGETRLARAA